MSKELSSFTLVDGHDRLWSAQKGTLRCTALRLNNGSLCLYSPVLGLGADAHHSLAALGEVSVLLAPNHYHHKGLAEYAQAFPDAQMICSDKARPRLEQQTGLTFASLDTLIPEMPDSWSLAAPAGLKTGEVWLHQADKGACTWVVTDAFKGPAGPTGCVREKIELLGTFPKFAIAAKADYAAWLSAQIARHTPTMIVPCHGAIVASSDLAADITALLN